MKSARSVFLSRIMLESNSKSAVDERDLNGESSSREEGNELRSLREDMDILVWHFLRHSRCWLLFFRSVLWPNT